MKSRLQNKQFYKCTKDYYRLKFIESISNDDLINTFNFNDDYIKLSIQNIHKIYKKDNPNIFKFPFSICFIEDDIKKQERVFQLYNDFLNLDIDKQIDILTNNKYLK